MSSEETNEDVGDDFGNYIMRVWYYSSDFRLSCDLARISGILSMLGAIYIIQDVMRHAERRNTTKNRIILLMSISDFIYSLFRPVLGTTLMPRGVDAPGTVGTQLTCTLQGFLSFSALYMSINYNMTLALCYVLMIVFGYDEDVLNPWYQSFLVLTPMVVGLSITIPALPIQGFNPIGSYGCEFANWPIACGTQDWSIVECERGFASGEKPWDVILFYQVLIALVVVTASMLLLYLFILGKERERIQAGRPGRNLANAMRVQGIWYCAVFVLTFLPFTIKKKFYVFSSTWNYIVACSTNLIGFLNAVVFIRPRFVKMRRDYPRESFLSSLRHTISRTVPYALNQTVVTTAASTTNLPPPALGINDISSAGSHLESSASAHLESVGGSVADFESCASAGLFPVTLNELEVDDDESLVDRDVGNLYYHDDLKNDTRNIRIGEDDEKDIKVPENESDEPKFEITDIENLGGEVSSSSDEKEMHEN